MPSSILMDARKLGWKKWTMILVLIAVITPPLVYYLTSRSSVGSVAFQLASVTRSPDPEGGLRPGYYFIFYLNSSLVARSATMPPNVTYPTFCLTADSYNLGCIFGHSATLKPNEPEVYRLQFRTGFEADPTAPSHFNQTRTSYLSVHMYTVTTAGWYEEQINRDSSITWTAG